MASRILRSLLALPVLAFGLAACTGGPGSEEDLVNALMEDDTFGEQEASCIAAAVFDEYGEDDEALSRISAANTFEELTGEDGIDGFEQTFERIVRTCTNTAAE